MTTPTHFQKLHEPTKNQTITSWFQDISQMLLNTTALFIEGTPHRLQEIEFYYKATGHLDPFTHGSEHQKRQAQWYFHREGKGYRGGSFKGLDITFGPEGAFGGILIRTIEAPDGTIINGCSLCVDHILKQTDKPSVQALDEGLLNQNVWQTQLNVHLAPHIWPEKDIIATARVGLTLKRAADHPTMPQFLLVPYRFLIDPTIKKGKIHTIMALHQRGLDAPTINTLTRSTTSSIQGHIKRHEAGSMDGQVVDYFGKALKTADLATLHGILHKSL